MRRILFFLFVVFSAQAMEDPFSRGFDSHGFGYGFKFPKPKRIEIFGIDYQEPRLSDFRVHKRNERVEVKNNRDLFKVCERYPEIFTHLSGRNAEHWYDVLGLRADASEDEILQAARNYTLKTHQDRSGRSDLAEALAAVRKARKNGLEGPDYCVVEEEILRAEPLFDSFSLFRRRWEAKREGKRADVTRTTIDTIFPKKVQDFADKVKEESLAYDESIKEKRDEIQAVMDSFDVTKRNRRIFATQFGKGIVASYAMWLFVKAVVAGFLNNSKNEMRRLAWRGDTEKVRNFQERITKAERYQKIIQNIGPVLTFGSGIVYFVLGIKNGRLYKEKQALAERCTDFNRGIDAMNDKINQANDRRDKSLGRVSSVKSMGRDQIFRLDHAWYCCDTEQYDRYAKKQHRISPLNDRPGDGLLRSSLFQTKVGAFLMGTGALWGLYRFYQHRKQLRATKEAQA